MVSLPTGRDQTLQDDLLSCARREVNSVQDRHFKVDFKVDLTLPSGNFAYQSTKPAAAEQHRANEG
jgi:hypothetical protein